tara:strand:- start:119 stop:286 length:168 start_codon:yes stop_codon:yes gene_type:complete
LPKHGLELFVIDPSKESIENGKKSSNNLSLKIGTSEKLDYKDKFFDIIIAGHFFI